jgi:hypothetical protein
MAEYALGATDKYVIRAEDGATIPNDTDNKDWVEYQEWLDAGGVPDPYVQPAIEPIKNTSDFIARFTNQEYAKLGNVRVTDAQQTKVGLSKNWDIVVMADTIELSKQKAQTLKADLVTAGVLTQTRADEIFS